MGINIDLFPAIFTLGVLANIVLHKYLGYLEAKNDIENSDQMMRETEEYMQKIPKDEWDRYPAHMYILNTWGKKRKEAAAYMEKHKLMGKLVERFHPKKIDNN